MDVERDCLPELVVAAVESTDSILVNGMQASRRFPAPLLFVQNDTDFFRDVFLEDRLVDRLESPFMREEFLARVDALTRVRRIVLGIGRSGEERRRTADAFGTGTMARVRSLGGMLAAVLGSRVPRYSKPSGPYMEVAARVADWSDHRDGFDPGHAERVACYCGMIADGLGLADRDVSALLRAALLHDIGKVSIPAELLRKQGPLEDDQMRLLRTHPQRGAAHMRELDRDDEVARTILYHHERMDGTGYYGKTDADVPVGARILAVAETFDAMTHSRVRETVDSQTAMHLLEDGKGSKFDGDCVDALTEALTPRSRTIPLSKI
jgi:putative nucleotidyltransferase with HDIG domain